MSLRLRGKSLIILFLLTAWAFSFSCVHICCIVWEDSDSVFYLFSVGTETKGSHGRRKICSGLEPILQSSTLRLWSREGKHTTICPAECDWVSRTGMSPPTPSCSRCSTWRSCWAGRPRPPSRTWRRWPCSTCCPPRSGSWPTPGPPSRAWWPRSRGTSPASDRAEVSGRWTPHLVPGGTSNINNEPLSNALQYVSSAKS